jgi:hypothetical protein
MLKPLRPQFRTKYDDKKGRNSVTAEKRQKSNLTTAAWPTLPKNLRPGVYDASAAAPGAFYPKTLLYDASTAKTPD